MKKFKKAQAQNQASIEKHLIANNVESSSSDDDNDGEVLETAVEKVLSNYRCTGGDTEKTLSYLTEIFQSGAAVCLICISSVKKTDAIWSCNACYTFMHLPCIQHWVRDSLKYKHEKGIKPLWGCPKCRKEYQENEIPRNYVCFCGNTQDPDYQPWLLPHSCGNTCKKFLQPMCGHKCLLLCHPGPCPPCPKMVSTSCFCGKQDSCLRRCNTKEWSCGEICNKKYESCEHNCTEKCHAGDCPPCSTMLLATCHCGNKSELRKCNESFWSCDKPCGRYYSCNIHVCKGFCHRKGDCNKCPLEDNRTCPCGKKKYAISCKQQQVPTCGDTCGKLLNCGTHYCNMRCHTDQCGQCLEVVVKTCRCGSFSKEIACVKEYHCNKKCTQIRLCGRHLCNKKCCDCLIKNNFNACEKVCDNMLNCRKHKCSAPCHSGPCYPCPRTIVIQCRCGNSKITVPCGTVKKIKPPHCNKKCKIPPICHHPKRESHKCHQGTCPPCRKICGLIYESCGHSCPAICHTKVWTKVMPNGTVTPIGPWENQKERWELKTFPCPPCEVSVMVTCLGGHETRPWPCHKAIPSSCLRECGKLLTCSNHYCEKLCHSLESECMTCEKPCAFERPKGCTHACPRICHPAPCSPCKQLVKVPCYCGISTLYIRCFMFTSQNTTKQVLNLNCGNQCPKLYPCGHRCIDNCHNGPCEKFELCSKKVKIFCPCKRLKKDFTCLDVRTNKAILTCNDICYKLQEEQKKLREAEEKRKRKEEEIRNLKEVEAFEKKFKPKRKGKSQYNCEKQPNDSNDTSKKLYIIAAFVIIISISIVLISQSSYKWLI